MMNNSKMCVGAASVLGAFVAAAALSGCTSSASPTASGSSTSAATTASTVTATGGGAGGAATGTQSTGGATTEGTAACTDSGLKIASVSAGAGAGHTGWILVFTNTGSAPCSIEGYPGAGVTDTPGQVVLNATRSQSGYLGGQYPSPATIVLGPGEAASTVLEWLDAPLNGETPVGANCPGMDSGKVLITPPNTRQSTPFPAPANLCADFVVHPLVPGISGRATQ
jgi:hypothetical protein